MNSQKNKKQIIKISVFVTSIFVIFLSVTYAFINLQLVGSKKQVITAGVLDLELDEDENNLTITDAFPMYDEVGMIQEPFTFRLINNVEMPTNYILKLVDITTGDKLPINVVKYGLTKNGVGEPKLLSTLPETGQIDAGVIGNKETIEYSLRLWIDESVTDNSIISGKSLSYRIDVEVSQEVEENTSLGYQDESGANVPQLTSGMIPVTYNGTNWVKADTTQEWYNYDEQWWANAVTVTEATRDSYMALDAGEPIDMDDINTMWVWIPRYEYKYTNLGTSYAGGTQTQPGEIEINFISSSTTAPSDSTVYKIPEGFTFGTENLSGFWMAKFETSTLETCVATDYSINTACDLLTLTPQVKPNVTSWRGARVSTFFEASRLMQSADDNLTYNADTYGFDTVGNGTMDVHMLKNTEWGIVAILSQSQYGKYGNPSYTGANKEVAINNCSSYITGIAGDSVNAGSSSSTCSTNTYETAEGNSASTTGTIYGIYDMSGGATEYVMGNYNNYSGDTSYNSGFCGTNGPTDGTCRAWPESKYVDVYDSNTASSAYKAGDATYETSGWYSDNPSFVNSYYPWFLRGGTYNYSTDAGLFLFNYFIGRSRSSSSSRFVIKP